MSTYCFQKNFIEQIKKTAQRMKDENVTYEDCTRTFKTGFKEVLCDVSDNDLKEGIKYIDEVYGKNLN